MIRLIYFTLVFLSLTGCASLPAPQSDCSGIMKQIPNDITPGRTRVFILKPQRSFTGQFSLLGDNTTGLFSTEKYEIFYESMENKIGDIRTARIVYFDVQKGVHVLYVKTNTQEDMTYVSQSKMVFDASDTIYFILQDLPGLSTSITGRGYLEGYNQVTQEQFIKTIQESCDRLNMLKASKLVIQ